MQADQPVTVNRLNIRSCAQPEVADPDVHTTVRQRIRAARKAEVRCKVNVAETKQVVTATVKKDSTNNVGQVLDNKEPAITRLIRGDFYSHKGTRAGEVLHRTQGTKTRQDNALAIPHAVAVGTNTENDTQCGQLHKGHSHKRWIWHRSSTGVL